jgi:hypothetical protein
MTRKLLSREEIEQLLAQLEAEYPKLPAAKVTDDMIRRWKRIVDHPAGHTFFDEAMRLSRQIPSAQLATDVFEHVAEIYRRQVKRPPGKRSGPHDPGLDDLLLYLWDQARNCRLIPGQTKKWSQNTLARRLEGSGSGWGTATTIKRRLERLINERNKRERNKQKSPTK